MHFFVMSLFSRDFIKMEIRLIKVPTVLNLVNSYLHVTVLSQHWFLDCGTLINSYFL